MNLGLTAPLTKSPVQSIKNTESIADMEPEKGRL